MNGDGRIISVVVPVYNEQECIPELLRRLRQVLASLESWNYEVLFVDDGSTDGTIDALRAGLSGAQTLKIIRLSRNFGHQAALTAGLDFARGDAVVILDADLQDPPEMIGEFVKKFQEGADVVYAYRTSREGPVLLRLCYASFYRLLNVFSSIPIAPDSGDFCLLSRRVVDAVKAMPERHRFLRGLRSWSGYKQIGVPLARPGRYAGRSKYSLSKLLGLALDGIISFSISPLRIASACGFAAIICSLLFALFAVLKRLLLNVVPTGFTAILVTLVFVSGVQLLFLGVIGEYVGRIYEETKRRPHYLVAEILSSAAEGAAPESNHG